MPTIISSKITGITEFQLLEMAVAALSAEQQWRIQLLHPK
jgi:hypothetical protein